MTAAPLLPLALPLAPSEGLLAPAPKAKEDIFSALLQMFGNDVAGSKDETKTEVPAAELPPAGKKTDAGQPPELDSSVTSTILAMMNQPLAPPLAHPLEMRKQISAPEPILKVDPKEAALPGVTTNETPRKSPLPPVNPPAVPETKASPAPVPEKQTIIPPAAALVSPAAPVVTVPDPSPAIDAVSVAPTNGTGVALEKPRMKFAAEKKEIAGSTVQKVPISANGSGGAGPTRSISALDAETDSDHSGREKDSLDPSLVGGWPARPADWSAQLNNGMSAAPTAEHPAAQVERVAQLVGQELVGFRQSGASSLSVSLKVDAHTELFLQVTTHNGQIEASVRCDRGDIAGLDSHWNDLQSSLSKQNVHLLPLEGKIPVVEPSASFNFDQAPQNSRRDKNDLWRDFPLHPPVKAVAAVTTTSPVSLPATSTSRLGWESWA